LIAAPAGAQAPRSNGPFSGLFGGDLYRPRTEALDIRGSVFGVSQDVLVGTEIPAPLDSGFQQSGSFGGATGAMAYSRRTDRARFAVNGGANLWEYAAGSERLKVASNMGTDLSANLSPKLVLDLRAEAAYSPFYQFSPQLFDGSTSNGATDVPDGGLLAPGSPSAAIAESHLDLNATANITSNFSRRSSVSGTLEWGQGRFLNNRANDVDSWGAGATFGHRLTKALGVHAGYRSGRARYVSGLQLPPSNDRVRTETIDIGLDYGDTLSFARRVFVTFSSSTSAIRFENLAHYRLNGRASITRGFARTWSASAKYVRDTEFTAGFRAPLLTDSTKGWLGGQLSARTRWGLGGAYSRGTVGFYTSEYFSTYVATTRLEIALARRVGVSTQYAYYRYRVPESSTSLALFDRLSQQTVTAGLTFWVPVINDSRTPRDTR
jgi:hypothetical protein